MKVKAIRPLILLAVMLLVLSACGPQSQSTSPPVTEAPVVTEPPAATESPVVTEPPVATVTPTLVAINLGGPVMEVGATYRYVDGSTLVAVPGGEFVMGYGNEENLEHKVILGDFWIYRDEVTNNQYALCVALEKCSPPNLDINQNYGKYERGNDPVTGVDWDQGRAYCEFVNGRLPTEAEWEKTARGPDGNIYPWGDATPTCELTNAGGCNPGTTEVTKHPKGASFYGAGGMAGNVFEWMADWFDAQYYRVSPAENPLGPETGTSRSVRSSAFRTEFYLTEVARRYRELPVKQRDDLGFRCVVEDPSLFAPWCQVSVFINPSQGGGGQPGSSLPTSDCPELLIATGGFCDKNYDPPQPAAYIDFGPDPLPSGSSINAPAGCTPDASDPSYFYCSGSDGEGSASIQAACTLPPPSSPPGCPPGYTQNGDTCEYTGGLPGNQCLPGVPFAADLQCCQAVPGLPGSFALCPSDAPYNVGGVCMPWPLNTEASQTVPVGLGSCGDDGGNDDGGNTTCPPPQQFVCYYDQSGKLVCGCR